MNSLRNSKLQHRVKNFMTLKPKNCVKMCEQYHVSLRKKRFLDRSMNYRRIKMMQNQDALCKFTLYDNLYSRFTIWHRKGRNSRVSKIQLKHNLFNLLYSFNAEGSEFASIVIDLISKEGEYKFSDIKMTPFGDMIENINKIHDLVFQKQRINYEDEKFIYVGLYRFRACLASLFDYLATKDIDFCLPILLEILEKLLPYKILLNQLL